MKKKSMKRLEQFIYEYGIFKDYRALALSFKDEQSGRNALNILQRMFNLMPEKEVEKRFPTIYRSLKDSQLELTDEDIYF